MPEEAKTGIEIDGDWYALPGLDDITIAEERILYVYADTVVSDFMPAHPDAEDKLKRAVNLAHSAKIRNPDFKRALVHIAYKRAHPDADDTEVQKLVGTANAFEVDVAMLRGDDERPPEMTSQKPPESASSISVPSTSSDSGSHTGNGSDPLDESPGTTGTTGSDTSSPLSLAVTSVS